MVATAPGYQSLTSLAEDLGCEVSLWAPVRSADGAALEFQVDELARLLRPGRTRVVFVNFPHNPTGCCPSSEEWGRAVEAVAGAGCGCCSACARARAHLSSPLCAPFLII